MVLRSASGFTSSTKVPFFESTSCRPSGTIGTKRPARAVLVAARRTGTNRTSAERMGVIASPEFPGVRPRSQVQFVEHPSLVQPSELATHERQKLTYRSKGLEAGPTTPGPFGPAVGPAVLK